MTQGHEPPGWVAVVRWVAIGVLALGLIASVAVWCLDFEHDVLLGLSVTTLGVAVSSGGAALAALIYQRQYKHAEASGSDLRRHIEEALRPSEAAFPLDSSEQEAAETDVGPDPDEDGITGRGVVVPVGNQAGRFFEPNDVPLSVLGNLVWGWRLNPETKQSDGRWTIANLHGAWRPFPKSADGRGNTPWYLTFTNSAGDRRVWRVYRGGKSKPEPTVRDVTHEDGAGDSQRFP